MQRAQPVPSRPPTADATPIEAAIKRLQLALDTLESSVERRLAIERHDVALVEQVHALTSDRAQLAAELDNATARARRLETANRDVAQRLDAAIETVRSVIAAQSR
jgi:Rad3-related DNA helicase